MLLGNPVAASSAVRAEAERRLRVCHIASGDLWAGAEVQIATLIRCLKTQELDVNLIVLNEGRLAESARASGVSVTVIPENQFGFLRVLSQASKMMMGAGVDVLHSHRYKENLLAACIARRCKIPVAVRTQHGLPEPFSGGKGFRHRIISMVDMGIAKFGADKVVSVSAELTSKLSLNLDPTLIATIANGLDIKGTASKFSRDEAKLRLGIPPDTVVLGTAARLQPIKRIDILLSSATIILKYFPEAKFVIAGDGSEREKLERLAQTKGIADSVLFLGQRNDVFDVLKAMDIFVLCSDHEGMPMVLLEALSLRVPVVARAVGGIPEVIEDGKNGLLISTGDASELADACMSLMRSPESIRRQLGEAGRTKVEECFSAEITATAVAQLYRDLVCVR